MSFKTFLPKLVKTALAEAEDLGTIEGVGGYLPSATDETGASVGEIITRIFTNLFGVLTVAGGIIFIIQFLLGAVAWISSSGKPEKVQKAQDKMIHAAIGLIAVVAVYGLTFIIGQVLGLNILNPADYIEKFWD
jgi:hypothetical protein